MDPIYQKLIKNIRSKDARDLIWDHMSEISFDELASVLTVSVDKRYVLHMLQSHEYLRALLAATHKTFGDDATLVLRLVRSGRRREREMLIPLTIHYGAPPRSSVSRQ